MQFHKKKLLIYLISRVLNFLVHCVMLLSIYLFQITGSTKKNIRHAKEIRASYLAFGIVCTFLLLNLPRIVASSIEVYHSNLILHCIKNEVRYVPSMNYYKLDFFARFFMVVNSAINFLIYCAVSSSFQVRKIQTKYFLDDV